MRYFQKLLCLLILVLAASFGVGGCVLLYSDFSVQRSRMAAANAAAHAQACTLLQTEILDLQRRGISTGDTALTARVTAQDVPAALWRGDTLVCATLEGLQSLPLGDAATVTVRTENSIYAVYASDLQGGLRLVTAYDLTGLYRDRNAALMRFLLLEAAVLAAASAVTALLARRLTRPLAVLTDAGAQIAAGDYARRTDLHTGDEIEELSRSFEGENPIYVTDVGQNQMWAAQHLVVDKPRHHLTSGGCGTMGFGLPGALGAAFAEPDKQVVHICGDGGFKMTGMELYTAAREGKKLISIVINNSCLGMVRQWQSLFFNKHYSATTLDRKTDFVKLAEAFGAKGVRTNTKEAFKAAFTEAYETADGPVVIDCKINEDELVLPMLPPGGSMDDLIIEKEEDL